MLHAWHGLWEPYCLYMVHRRHPCLVVWCAETIGCCMVSQNYAACTAWSVGTILIIYGAQKTYMPGGMVCRNHRMLYGFTQLCWMHGMVCGNHIDYIWCTETIGCCMVSQNYAGCMHGLWEPYCLYMVCRRYIP